MPCTHTSPRIRPDLAATALAVVALAFVSVASHPASAGADTGDEHLAGVVADFVTGRAANDEFAGVVLVSHGANLVVDQAWGEADRGFHVPNNTDTRFGIGSIGKVFTGVAVCLLAQRGELSFDDTIDRFLPDYPREDVARSVTVEHLLTHTSGLGDFFNTAYGERRGELRTIEDYLSLFASQPPDTTPGVTFSYSNAGPVVLGRIIEVCSGMSYYDFVRKNIFDPAGMTASGFFEGDEIVENRAVGYTHWRIRYDDKGMDGERVDEWRSNIATLAGRPSPAGGVTSTAADMLAFARALLGERLLDREHLDAMLTTRIERRPGRHYGYLINVRDAGGHRALGHNGGAAGSSASFWMYPDLDYTIVVLANQDDAARPVWRFIEREITGAAAR